MRSQTEKVMYNNTETNQHNVIIETRNIIKGMTEQQLFQKAKQHVNDALYYKYPRPQAYSPNMPSLFVFCYTLQTSNYWTWLLYFCTYLYLYIVCLDPYNSFKPKLIIQVIILTIYWFDVGLYLYHKSYQKIKISSKFQLRFYIKVAVLILLIIDFLIFSITQARDIRYFRPFRFFRGLLPIFYDALTRKSFQALFHAWKDIVVYVCLYFCIIFSFALMANQFFVFPEGYQLDQYKQNYPNLLRAIYVIYTLSSYDSYPDNQLVAIKWSQWSYAFFILFALLNMFFFVTIPGTIISRSFRSTRSKTTLIDEIRQHHSLILAFVSIAGQQNNIDRPLLIRFLLYFYKYKTRYVGYITQICIKLDQNNNGTVQVSQFMQLCKFLTKNSHMLPPQHDDFQPWVKLRRLITKYTELQFIVKSWTYRFINNFIIVLTFINCIVLLSTEKEVFKVADNVFQAIFIMDFVLRILGLGYQCFFKDKWNSFDFFIVFIILLLQIIPDGEVPHNSAVIIKMFRIFRIATLIKLFTNQGKYTTPDHGTIYSKAKRLLGETAVVIPIILKFFPVFLIIYYFLGITGMELFHYAEMVPPTQFGIYSQFSHYKQFINTQYILVQVLVQAGWSMIAFDYAKRTQIYFPVVLYFMVCHVTVVLIMSALFKALVWQVYFTVHDQFEEQAVQQINLNKKDHQIYKKMEQFSQIKQIIEQNGFIIPNTVIKREFLQNKLDIQIFKCLKQLYLRKMLNSKTENKRLGVIQQIVLNKKKYLMAEDSSSNNSIASNEEHINRIYQKIFRENLKNDELEAIQLEDFEQQMERLMQSIVLHPKIQYSETMVYPKVLLQLLQQKMIKPFNKVLQRGSQFNINQDVLQNKSSMEFHNYELNVLLEIQRSERDQKMQIIKYMNQNKLITDEQAQKLFSKKVFQRNHHIKVSWIIRKMFLHQTNEELIKKFQIEYFSDIYGQSFRQINKVTIQPLLRYEALLTYNFRNIMRYPKMSINSFFSIFTKIENEISNNLLKKGSMFKFVYQVQTLSDNWFTVEFKESDEAVIHFIKTGVWIYHNKMQANQIYYARDFFNWNIKDRSDKITCQKILKLLYETFEGLAFGLLNQNPFFTSDPQEAIYDIYSFFVDVSKIERFLQRKLQISKVMLVILSKQQDRLEQNKLEYELTEIFGQKNKKKSVDFKFDQSQRQTFQKLKNLSAMDHQKIIQSEGLPFAYIINLMRQVKEILSLHSRTLVNKMQIVLNQQFQSK